MKSPIGWLSLLPALALGLVLGFASCGEDAETCQQYYSTTTSVSAENKDFCLNQRSKTTGNCCVANSQCVSGRCCEKGQDCGGGEACECMP